MTYQELEENSSLRQGDGLMVIERVKPNPTLCVQNVKGEYIEIKLSIYACMHYLRQWA